MTLSTIVRRGCLAALTMLVCIASSNAATWYVSTDGSSSGDGTSWEAAFDTIQAGIDAAVNGDTVMIASGTYAGEGNRDIDFNGKAITVRKSPSETNDVLIDCESEGRGFLFHSGEGADSVIMGLLIQNGYADDYSTYGPFGGAVYCKDSSPIFTECDFVENKAFSMYWYGQGGGIYCENSSPSLTDCMFLTNIAEFDMSYGGAMMNLDNSSPSLVNCRFFQNQAAQGGGIYNQNNSSPTLTGCLFDGNQARDGGAALTNDNSDPVLADCTFSNNIRKYNSSRFTGGGVQNVASSSSYTRCYFLNNEAVSGAGMYNLSSSPVLLDCLFSGNIAQYQESGTSAQPMGGGLRNDNSSPDLINCVFVNNKATSSQGDGVGGGIFSVRSAGVFTNCIILNNTSDIDGGGMQLEESAPILTNSIVWGNSPQGFVHVPPPGEPSSLPVITWSDIQDGTGESWFGVGCIDIDPLFANNDMPYLLPGSPCIDAGTNTPPVTLPAEDLDGNPRVVDGNGDGSEIVDMGVMEFNPSIPVIQANAEQFDFHVPLNGSNPADQLLTIRNAGGATLRWQITGQPSWLTVSPASGESVGEATDVTLSVDIDGMDRGEYMASLQIADPQATNSPVAVRIDLRIAGILSVPSEYSTIQDAIDTAVVQGDVVELADGMYLGDGNKNLDFQGKMITVRSASGNPELCVIDCEQEGCGFNFHSNEGLESVVEGLTVMNGRLVSGSTVGVYGSAIQCENASPTLKNCVFTGNRNGKGTIYSYSSNPVIINCDISSNECTGVYNEYYSNPTLVNCIISDNGDPQYGGGICNWEYCSPTLTNCTISGNHAYLGGGVCNLNHSCPVLMNCVVVANTARQYGGGIYNYYHCIPEMTNCTFSDNVAESTGGAIYIRGLCPFIIHNSIFWGNSPNEFDTDDEGIAYNSTYSIFQNGFMCDTCKREDPGFVDPDGPDGDPATWQDNDYRLSPGSPGIDAADNSLVPSDVYDLDGDGDVDEMLPFDLGGFARFIDDPRVNDTGNGSAPIVDMGAYEYQAPLMGDIDRNGDVDLNDLALFVDCLAGPDVTTPPAGVDPVQFILADLDGDGDVDLGDFAIFQQVF